MICPECGSYQPDKAKFCGNCGTGLSRDSLLESFLGSLKPQEMELPRRRSAAFYLGLALAVLIALAVLLGMAFLVYRYAVQQKELRDEGGDEDYLTYTQPDTGLSLSYHRHYELKELTPEGDELFCFELVMGSDKSLEIKAFRLDPDVLVGGMESIYAMLREDVLTKMRSEGGEGANFSPSGMDEEAGAEGGTEEIPGGEGVSQRESEPLSTSSVRGNPAYYADFRAKEKGFLVFYVISEDLVFMFTGRSLWAEFPAARRQFMAVIGSFQRDTSR